MISVSSLSVAYGKKGKLVLKDVDFALEKGQIGVVLGPNGAGKSTLLKCCLGLLKPQSGGIMLDGKPILDISPRMRAKAVAYVPQILSFAPATVFDATLLGRMPHFGIAPGKEDERIVLEVLERLGLLPLKERNVMDLSGGERQKVAIARALAQGADIIVFDEPTSNLDIAAEAQIAELVSSLSKDHGKTVLLSLHDLNLAYHLGDRFLFLKDGNLIAAGDKSVFNRDNVYATFGVIMNKIETPLGDYMVFGGK